MSEWILVCLLLPMWLWENYQTSLRRVFLILQRVIIMSRAGAVSFLDTSVSPHFLGLQLNYITQAPLQGGVSLWLDLPRACAECVLSLGLVLLQPHSSFCWLQPGRGCAAFNTLTRAIQYRTGEIRGKKPLSRRGRGPQTLLPDELKHSLDCFVREKEILFLKLLFSYFNNLA